MTNTCRFLAACLSLALSGTAIAQDSSVYYREDYQVEALEIPREELPETNELIEIREARRDVTLAQRRIEYFEESVRLIRLTNEERTQSLALIAEASNGATIYFETGTFELDQTIVIERDDITLVGAEDGSTIFNFTFETGNEGNGIEVNGGHKQHLTEVTLDADSGSDQIIVADSTGIEPGDVLYIRQPNDPEYLLENGWDNVSWEDADDRPFREIIVRVASVSGDVVTLADPLPYDLDDLIMRF